MLGNYSIEELELNSQTLLLSRIQFLMRFTSNLLQIIGENGAGKTWLSESYLEKWATETTQALLLCNSNQKDEQHRAIILRQIVPDSTFNVRDSLVQSLSNMLRDEAVHALIVIDDAHLLSANLAKELWQLVSVAQERVGWQINVLLFSRPSKLSKALQKAARHQKEKPIEIEVTPLNESERELLTSAITQSFRMDGAGRRSFKIRIQDAEPLPGAIIDCAYPKLASQTTKSSSLFIPITVAVLLLVLSVTLVFWLQIPNGMSPGQYLTQLWSDFSKEGQDKGIPKLDINSLAKEDRVTLPEQPNDNEMSVGYTEDDKKSVVLDADTTDAMINKQTEEDENVANNEYSTNADGENINGTTENELDITQLPDVFASETSTLPKDFPTIPVANKMLLDVPSSRYALQLGAFQTRKELREFIHQYDLLGRVLVYETFRGGALWYMVLLGDYPSVVEARRTELELSENLRSLGPWAKSFTQIHKEISLVQ